MQGVIPSGPFVALYVGTLIRQAVGGNVENIKSGRLLIVYTSDSSALD